MENHQVVTVEFFGIPRQRAGRTELVMEADTVAQMMATVKTACPGLNDLVEKDGRLASHYLLSIEGKGFVKDSRQVLEPGTRVLLLSADVGG